MAERAGGRPLRDAGRPPGRDHFVRRHGGRVSRGAAHPSESDRRRPRGLPRKRRAAGRDHPVRIRAVVIRGHRVVAGDLAAERRRACPASSVRRRRAGTTDQRTGLRCAGCPRAAGLAAGRGRHAVADADAAPCDRALARAGTGGLVTGMAGRTGRADRRLSVRRGRSVWRPPSGRWRAGADSAGAAARASGCGGRFDHRRDPADAEGQRWRCAGR